MNDFIMSEHKVDFNWVLIWFKLRNKILSG